MKSVFVKAVLLLATLGSFGACSDVDPKLEALKPKEEVKKVESRVNPLGALPMLDVLFVIDDSASMGVHQATLAQNIERFVNTFSSGALLDYHIGVVTTSIDGYSKADGKLYGTPKFVDRSTPNGLAALKKNLNVGINGSGTEQMFQPFVSALGVRLTDYNAGFYREDALLAVIIITDAEEQGTMNPQTAYDFLVTQKKAGRKDLVSISVVNVPIATDGCQRDDSAMLPVRLEEFVQIAKATNFSLCDADYGTKLAAIGQDLFRKVIKVLHLTRAPVVSTIVVKYGTQIIPEDSKTGWTYDPATVSIIFGDDVKFTTQPEGTELDIRFDPIDFDNTPSARKKPQPN